jgi:DNA-binding Lrp family transcriptional regulator
MTEHSSLENASFRKDSRDLDSVDLKILRLLIENGRMPNSLIAEAVSIAESTCHARIRSLVDSGIIRGFHADVEESAIGFPVQALVLVELKSNARPLLLAEAQRLAKCDGVVEVLFLAGSMDLAIRIAIPNTSRLRDFIMSELNAKDTIASTKTSVVLESVRGRGATPTEDIEAALAQDEAHS